MTRVLFLICAMSALAVGASAASANNGNSGAAHQCQQGSWQNLAHQDGAGFRLVAKLGCLTGSEDFSEDAVGSQPTASSGGAIDTAYAPDGGVLGPTEYPFLSGNALWSASAFPAPFQLTFTFAVGSAAGGRVVPGATPPHLERPRRSRQLGRERDRLRDPRGRRPGRSFDLFDRQ